MHLLPRDSVPARQSFELLVRLYTAVFAHDGLHSFCQYFPAGVKVGSEGLRVHDYLSQAMQQGVERHNRISKRRANVTHGRRVAQIPLQPGRGQRGRQVMQQGVAQARFASAFSK